MFLSKIKNLAINGLLFLPLILSLSCQKDDLDELNKRVSDLENTEEENIYFSDLEIHNQANIDSIQTKGITKVLGELVISGDDITDLQPLYSLREVGGLRILNTSLKNLKGIDSLIQIHGDVKIFRNHDLEKIDNFHHIKTLIDLDISDNLNLKTISGFNSLKEIKGSLFLTKNPLIKEIEGFENTEVINGSLEISKAGYLISLNNFINLITVGNNLRIDSNNSLSEIEFPRVENVSSLTIIGNPKLKDINVPHAKSLEYLRIINNSSLEEITGFSGLTKLSQISFFNNDSLTSIPSFDKLEKVKSIDIYNNESLKTIDGFNNVEDTVHNLYLSGNDQLTKLNGFNKITSLRGNFNLNYNSQLETITGFNSLTHIDGSFSAYSSGLKNLEVLKGVTKIGGHLELQYISSLTNLSHLSELKEVGGNIALVNIFVTTLDGLENISKIGGNVEIRNNWLLEDFCAIKNVWESGNIGGAVIISGNRENPSDPSLITDCQ